MEAFNTSMRQPNYNLKELSKAGVNVARTSGWNAWTASNASASDGGTHHAYSISPDKESVEFPLEGITAYVFPSPMLDRLPLYRFYKQKEIDSYDWDGNPVFKEGSDRYFYITNRTVPKGYTFQGIDGYVSTIPGSVKLNFTDFIIGK